MFLNYLSVVLFLIAAYLTGQAFLCLFQLDNLNFRTLPLLGLPVGIALLAMIAGIFYLRLGTSVFAVRIAYLVTALISIFILIRKKIPRARMQGLFVFLLLFTVMILPGVFRGTKYYVHRGNIWDKEFYLSEVVYMSAHTLAYGTDGLPYEEYPSDVLQFGYNAIQNDRPIVPLLCATLTKQGMGSLFFLGYLFINLMWAAVFGPMMFLMELVAAKKPFGWYAFFSLAYLWGFYGQIQNDIDAWSQMTAWSVLLTFTGVWFVLLKGVLFEEEKLSRSRLIGLSVLGAGSFLIYPENTMIHGGLLIITTVFAYFTRRHSAKLQEIGKAVLLPVAILGLAWLIHPHTTAFALYQIRSAESDVRQSWASYFDAYWWGYHTFAAASPLSVLIKKLTAMIPSWSGMFIITPIYVGMPKFVVIPWLIFVGLVGIGVIGIFVSALVSLKKTVRRQDMAVINFVRVFTGFGVLIFLFMVVRAKYWSAGKLLLYLSPYLYLLLSGPLSEYLLGQKKPLRLFGRFLLSVSCLFIVCQCVFAGMRVRNIITNDDCTGYLGSYPSDQMPKLKQDYPYAFDAKNYAGENVVAIRIKNGWYQDYVKLSLAYEGIPYYAVPDANFGGSGLKEVQPVLKDGDTVITKKDTR